MNHLLVDLREDADEIVGTITHEEDEAFLLEGAALFLNHVCATIGRPADEVLRDLWTVMNHQLLKEMKDGAFHGNSTGKQGRSEPTGRSPERSRRSGGRMARSYPYSPKRRR